MGKKGIQHALEAIRYLSPKEQARLLKNVEALDPTVAEALKSGLFGFEDLIRVNPKGITSLVSSVPESQWSLALRKASVPLAKYIFDNISQRRADQLREFIKADGPKPLSKVLEAQDQIVEKALELEKNGRLAINRNREEDPLV